MARSSAEVARAHLRRNPAPVGVSDRWQVIAELSNGTTRLAAAGPTPESALRAARRRLPAHTDILEDA